ncbi:uncharacterized protein [Oscarella lobularis]|uniref:uncharacterized protein isoform X2 n=1 Tax=Oscarella lobularis TaxID=121494 RepID=UPI00331354A6
MLGMASRHRTLEEAVETLKNELDPQTFGTYMALVKRAVQYLLETKGEGGRVVQKAHPVFGPIIAQSAQARLIMFMLGFEDVDEDEDVMVMFDFDGHAAGMRSFKDIAEKQLINYPSLIRDIVGGGGSGSSDDVTTTTERISSNLDFDESEDKVAVTTRMGHFFFMRLMPLVLFSTRSPDNGASLKEQVSAVIEVIEKCASILHVVREGTVCHQSWLDVCADARRLADAFLPVSSRLQESLAVSSKITETANIICNELRVRHNEQHVEIFVFMHLSWHLCQQTTMGQLLTKDDMQNYVRVSCSFPSDQFSQEYAESVEKVRCFIVKALDQSLSSAEIREVHDAVVWQKKSFLQHIRSTRTDLRISIDNSRVSLDFEVPEIGLGDDCDLPTLLQMRERMERQVARLQRHLNVVPSPPPPPPVERQAPERAELSENDSDGEEKKDEPEKTDKDKEDEDEEVDQARAIAIVHPYNEKEEEEEGDQWSFEAFFSRVAHVSSVAECQSLQCEVSLVFEERQALVRKLREDCASLSKAFAESPKDVANVLETRLRETTMQLEQGERDVFRINEVLTSLEIKAKNFRLSTLDTKTLKELLERIARSRASEEDLVVLVDEIRSFMKT